MRAHAVLPARRLIATAAVVLVATVALVGPLAQPSQAADYTANSESTWRQAVNDAAANIGETNTITITGDFTMDDTFGSWPVYASVSHDLIIDGGGHTVTASATNLAGLIDIYDTSADITIRNLTLDNFASNYAAYVGTTGDSWIEDVTISNFHGPYSGLHVEGYEVQVDNSSFTNNSSMTSSGGALDIYCSESATISGSTFTSNQADGDGGAVHGEGCELEVENSLFHDNSAVNGGAIYGMDADVETYESTFTNNSATGDGGAIYAYGIDAEYSTFRQNSADGSGGALAGEYGAEPDSSSFTLNTADINGGAIIVMYASFSAYDSTFTNNSANGQGGAAWGFNYADSHESTWVGNQAAYGGAIYSAGDSDYSYYLQSTFVGNTATVEGGAVYAENEYVEVNNTTMTGNEAPAGAHVYVANDYLEVFASVFDDAVDGDGCYADTYESSLGYTFDDDGTCTDGGSGTGDLGEFEPSPLLGPLADNGGPTHTRSPLPGSPLINAIPWATCTSEASDEFDQRGVYREDTGAIADGCDIGAVEVIPALVIEYFDDEANLIATASLTNALDSECSSTYTLAELGGTAPAGVTFPYGGFDFCIELPDDGWSSTVTWQFPGPVNQMWKIDDGAWTKINAATFAGNTVTYTIVDGGALDLDGDVDGSIYDPVAAGVGAAFTG
jgi:predicted outer membrane repeat protein